MDSPSAGLRGRVELDRWERVAGTPIGAQPGISPLPAAHAPALEALGRAVLTGLQRPPCTVSFSGGRDSSAVLALAARVARAHGLQLPVPLTLRFPDAGTTHESEWQELVVAHLSLPEWERVEIRTELDFLGDVACDALLRHGLLWPANAHVHAPLLARAAGGSLLTGFDGDGLFNWSWPRLRARLSRRGVASARDVLRAGFAMSPTRVRFERYRRRPELPTTWLRPAARRHVSALTAAARASEPRRWDRRVDWYARQRYPQVAVQSLDLLAGRHDTLVCHPLLDRDFLAALAAGGGRGGYGDRTASMRHLFAGLLPDSVITRRSKAEFGAAFWGPAAQAFAASWDGSGLDNELVDADGLREAWAGENPFLHTALLMQQAWLAANARG